jgi:hypothetical protein
MKGKFIAKCIFFGILFIGCFFALGYVIMHLWNWLMPALFSGLHEITYLQAFGLLILSKLLFGGFGGHWKRHGGCGGHCGGRHSWRSRWEGKWSQMTPEEREKFKKGWGGKCGQWEASSETKTE